MEHSHLLRQDAETNFKAQYKTRTNWSRGSCRVKEVEVGLPSELPLLAKVSQGMVYTVDSTHGLRAWSHTFTPKLLATQPFMSTESIPTCFAVDASNRGAHVTVGFGDGHFGVWTFELAQGFLPLCDHSASSDGDLVSMALAMPYVLTMCGKKILRLYRVLSDATEEVAGRLVEELASLRSEISYAPCSLSIRQSPKTVIASIAYSFSRLNAGWCIGLQELRLTKEGQILNSRVVSTVDTPLILCPPPKSPFKISSRSASSRPFPLHPDSMDRPKSLSYCHPYLLAALGDSTLMVYLVTSDGEKLDISTGRRLFGHTNGVCAAEVSDRGKAVSVSRQGKEIRVWDLEEALTTFSQRKESTRIIPITQLDRYEAAVARLAQFLRTKIESSSKDSELASIQNWVGFDDEQVVILGDRDTKQILSCYDFT